VYFHIVLLFSPFLGGVTNALPDSSPTQIRFSYPAICSVEKLRLPPPEHLAGRWRLSASD
jgi:hypothetical protein